MTEVHHVFKDKAKAQSLADQLRQLPANAGKVTFTQVDRFSVNDCTADPDNPQPVCNMINGPYYVVSVIA
jgi:hypothetical protein